MFSNIKNYYMEKVVRCCVEYKLNVHRKNYNKALEEINKLRNILEIDVSDNEEIKRKVINISSSKEEDSSSSFFKD